MNPSCDFFIEHPFRRECKRCNMLKVDHFFDLAMVNVVRTALDLEITTPMASFMDSDYLWKPKRFPMDRIDEFFGYLPKNKVPLLNKPGEKFRQKQWEIQIPYDDLSAENCRFMNDEKKAIFQKFIFRRNDNNIDEAYVKLLEEEMPAECAKCQRTIESGELVVRGTKDDSERVWHPACFVCSRCGELPVDLIHCIDETGLVLCIRHFDEQYKPRCTGCNELIFEDNFTLALGKNWHTEHFCCYGCDAPLHGMRHFSRNDRPFCMSCYEEKYRHICKKCDKKISVIDEDYSCGGEHWHEPCFICDSCSKSLADREICRHEDKMFCDDCYYDQYAERCEKCGEHFRFQNLKVEYEGQHWHCDCFICSCCSAPIKTQKFVNSEDGIYCVPCYRIKHAFPCTNCQKPIAQSGINYRNKHFHRTCFLCESCKKPLEKKVISQDNKHYCEICYIETYSKVCFACKKVILGRGAFCKFEDKSWHKQCFHCFKCQKPLAGKEFLNEDEGLLCEECGM